DAVDSIGVQMPPAAADAEPKCVRELVRSDALDLKAIAGARGRVYAEHEEVVIDRLLPGMHPSRIRGELHMIPEHQVGGCTDAEQVPVVCLADDFDGGRQWERLARILIAGELRAATGSNGLIPAAVTDEAAHPKAGLPDDGVPNVDRAVAQGGARGTRSLRVGNSHGWKIFIE